MVAGMILGMVGSLALVSRLGRHLLHIGIVLIAVGAAALALTLTDARAASMWELVPGLFLMGAGVGASIGQLFRFILTSVTMDEVGSASGVLEAVQQLSTSLGVAVPGSILFSAFAHHLPSYALRITAWACLAPLAAAFVLVFGCPCSREKNRRTSTPGAWSSIRGMPSVIKTVTWDCSDALVDARFWAAALGSDVDEDSTAAKAFVEAAGWGGPTMWFNQVPEPKTAKNRLHFDLRAPAGMAEEVDRLEALGATVVRRDAMLTVMRDPAGNEFCVEPGPAG